MALSSSTEFLLLDYDTSPLCQHRTSTNVYDKVRVVILGSKEVGKTSVFQGFKNCMNEELSSALPDKLSFKTENVTVELMDSNEIQATRLKSMTIQTSHAFVLVYAVDNPQSFEYIRGLREEIMNLKGHDIPIVVVGNKVDVTERKVHPVVADCMVTIDWECPHVEVSATTSEITDVFYSLFNHPRFKANVSLTKFLKMTKRKASVDSLPSHEGTYGRLVTNPNRRRSSCYTWQHLKQAFQ